MAETLALVCPAEPSERLNRVLNAALRGCPHERISWLTDPLCNRRLLFALPISAGGPGHSFYDLLAFLRTHPGCLSGSVGGVIADGILPRKTFSMGHAREKRYYLEGRTIIK